MTTTTKIKIVAIVLLISLSLAVIIQNTSPIEARLLFLTIQIPLTLLIGASLIAGYLLGLLTPILWRRGRPSQPVSLTEADSPALSERALPESEEDPRTVP